MPSRSPRRSRALGRGAETVQADVTHADEVRRMRPRRRGRTCCSTTQAPDRPREPHLTEEEWDEVFAVNARGPFLVTEAALPLLAEADEARVINIGTVMAYRGAPGNLA